MEEDFYTVDEAVRILKLTPGRIRQTLRAGELEDIPPEESGGAAGRYLCTPYTIGTAPHG